ncbi:MAG: type II secretion system protein GspG [Candidatus Omnitrophica bacterium]|nr:type II secretion system protein GspG [Candidatus Omnitrophota bacterium]
MDNFGKIGFTIIEILVSIFILSTILSISLPVLHRARNKAMISKTKSIIDTIETALSLYETDFGDYPFFEPYPEQNEMSKILYEKLQGPCESERWNGPYIRFKKEQIDKDKNIIDAWKNPIIYKYPQNEYDNIPFLLLSAGPDRKFGTDDDIGNW